MADAAGAPEESSDGGQHVRPGTAMSGASRPHSAAHGGRSSEDPARAHALPVHAVEERPRPSSSLMSTSLPHAYIHDAFESLHGSGGAPVGRSAHRRLPDHLLFDVSKTQLVKRGPRARVATPAEPVRGFKNQAEATKLPAKGSHAKARLRGTRDGLPLAPLHASAREAAARSAQSTAQSEVQEQEHPALSRDGSDDAPRPHTSLGVESGSESAGPGVDKTVGAANSVSMTGTMSVDDLRSSWLRSGALANDAAHKETPEITAARMLMTMPHGTRYRFDKKVKDTRRKPSASKLMLQNKSGVTLDEANRTLQDYQAEMSTASGTPIPAHSRIWPHVVLDTKTLAEGEFHPASQSF